VLIDSLEIKFLIATSISFSLSTPDGLTDCTEHLAASQSFRQFLASEVRMFIEAAVPIHTVHTLS